MRSLKILSKILSLICLISLSLASTMKASRNFDSDNPQNPLDAKNVTLTIFNKTDMQIKTSFFLENKKVSHGKIIEPGQSLIFDVEGRYNKKRAYFRFRIPGDQTKGSGVRFFYKQAVKTRGTKIDEIYLLQDDQATDQNNFIISTTPQINPITTILKADINAKLLPMPVTEKHKKSDKSKKFNKDKQAPKKHKQSKRKSLREE